MSIHGFFLHTIYSHYFFVIVVEWQGCFLWPVHIKMPFNSYRTCAMLMITIWASHAKVVKGLCIEGCLSWFKSLMSGLYTPSVWFLLLPVHIQYLHLVLWQAVAAFCIELCGWSLQSHCLVTSLSSTLFLIGQPCLYAGGWFLILSVSLSHYSCV